MICSTSAYANPRCKGEGEQRRCTERLEVGDRAPFAGILFDDNAAAWIVVERARSEQTCRAEKLKLEEEAAIRLSVCERFHEETQRRRREESEAYEKALVVERKKLKEALRSQQPPDQLGVSVIVVSVAGAFIIGAALGVMGVLTLQETMK